MGFFDDLGKRVTDAGQKTVQKTREMSEIARINSLISQSENKMNTTYYQIGKLYVSMHGNEGEKEFAGMVAIIEELSQQITAYREQIQDIKGIQHCEKCGAEVPRGVAFCSSCGATMPKVEKQVNSEGCIRCPGCGAMVKKEMRFCTACGQAIDEPAASAVVSEEVLPLPEEVAEKTCPKCGAKLEADSIFCTECGTKL